MNVTTSNYLITQQNNLNVLQTPYGNVPFKDQMTVFTHLFRGLILKLISGPDGLRIVDEAAQLGIPLMMGMNNPDNEWMTVRDVFEKKAWSEKNEKPTLFLCAGCGQHAYITGPDFFYPKNIVDKEDGHNGIIDLYEDRLIAKNDVVPLFKQLSEIKLVDVMHPMEKYMLHHR